MRQYKSRADAWRESIAAAERKRKLFEDIFADDGGLAPSPKKSAKSSAHKVEASEQVEAVLESDASWVSDKHKKAMKTLMGGLEPVLASATPKTEGASSKKKKRKRGDADEHEPQHEEPEAPSTKRAKKQHKQQPTPAVTSVDDMALAALFNANPASPAPASSLGSSKKKSKKR